METYFGDGRRWGVQIRYFREDKPLSTAGALRLIDGLQENFLLMNGDILTTLDYRKLFELHLEKGGVATIGPYIHKDMWNVPFVKCKFATFARISP